MAYTSEQIRKTNQQTDKQQTYDTWNFIIDCFHIALHGGIVVSKQDERHYDTSRCNGAVLKLLFLQVQCFHRFCTQHTLRIVDLLYHLVVITYNVNVKIFIRAIIWDDMTGILFLNCLTVWGLRKDLQGPFSSRAPGRILAWDECISNSCRQRVFDLGAWCCG